MNEKVTEPTGFYFAVKNEDGSYGDPKPMPGVENIEEITVMDNNISSDTLAAAFNTNSEVCVDLATSLGKWFESGFGKDPIHKIYIAEAQLKNFISLYVVGSNGNRRKLKRYVRRYARAVMNWRRVYYGGKKKC